MRLLILLVLLFIQSSVFSQFYVGSAQQVKIDSTLHILGDLNNNGLLVGSDFIEFSQGKLQSIKGDGMIENLSINKTSNTVEIVSGYQSVFRNFKINGGNLKANERLTLKSSDTLTAIINQSSGGTIEGNFIVEKYLPQSNRAFRYFSSPVSTTASVRYNLQENQNNTGTDYPEDNLNDSIGYGTHITGNAQGLLGFDATLTGNASAYQWDNINFAWDSFDNTNTKTLSKGETYTLLIRGSRASSLNSNFANGPATTLRLRGNPTLGTHSFNFTANSADNFFMIGNPYHSVIDIKSALQSSTGLNTNFIYVYDPTINTRGAYVTVDLSVNTNNNVDSPANQYLQPWQSIFIRASGAGNVSIDFDEADKNNTEPQYQILSLSEQIVLNLKSNQTSEVLDAVVLKFNALGTILASKLFNNDENIAVIVNQQYTNLAKIAELESDTISIFTNNYRKTNYNLEVDLTNFNQKQVYLRDHYLNSLIQLNLNEVNAYNFQVDSNIQASVSTNRFSLVFNEVSLNHDEFDSPELQVYPNPFKSKIKFNTTADINLVEVYNLKSQLMFSQKPRNKTINLSHLKPGVYVLKLSSNNNSYFKKVIKTN